MTKELPPRQERLVALFLEAIEPFLGTDAERETGVPKASINRARAKRERGEPLTVRAENAEKIRDYLRKRGLLPADLDPKRTGLRTLEDYAGARVQLAIRHFSNDDVINAVGWGPQDVVAAVGAYALSEKFDGEEMHEVREWRSMYLSKHESEG